MSIIAAGRGRFSRQDGANAYNVKEMAIALVRRILYGALAAWVFVMAVEQFRMGGHTGTAIAFSVGGIVLLVLAITGKGG